MAAAHMTAAHMTATHVTTAAMAAATMAAAAMAAAAMGGCDAACAENCQGDRQESSEGLDLLFMTPSDPFSSCNTRVGKTHASDCRHGGSRWHVHSGVVFPLSTWSIP